MICHCAQSLVISEGFIGNPYAVSGSPTQAFGEDALEWLEIQ